MQTTTRQTPGVYITELDAFPTSVVGVQTAVPAFIGYTQQALNGGRPITGKPTLINSLADYEMYFGTGPVAQFTLATTTSIQVPDFTVGANNYTLTWEASTKYILYNCIRLFYANGGGPCYIVSVGPYNTVSPYINLADLESGLSAISNELGPTMLLIPDALNLVAIKRGAPKVEPQLETRRRLP